MKICAELSASHLGSLDRCIQLMDAAKMAGADAVKIQTWRPEGMVLDKELVAQSGPWKGTNLYDLYEESRIPWSWHKELFRYASDNQIELFSSVFDIESLEMLEDLRCPRYKIASFELIDLPLIQAVAKTGKPIILSTGMGTAKEIADAVQAARSWGHRDVTLLKCTSSYPALIEEANLTTMQALAGHGCYVGVSDHTMGHTVAVAATALGANMIEKHLTLSRADGGPDKGFSMEPAEFAEMVRAVKETRQSLGRVRYGPTKGELSSLELRRSLYFTKALLPGTVIQEGDVTTARPALGLAPCEIRDIIGRKVLKAVVRGVPVTWDLLN